MYKDYRRVLCRDCIFRYACRDCIGFLQVCRACNNRILESQQLRDFKGGKNGLGLMIRGLW